MNPRCDNMTAALACVLKNTGDTPYIITLSNFEFNPFALVATPWMPVYSVVLVSHFFAFVLPCCVTYDPDPLIDFFERIAVRPKQVYNI
jgi:hypothetical protein